MAAALTALCLALPGLGGFAAVPVAHAGDDWCMDDPSVPVVTPAGNTVVVNVTTAALGTQHLAALQAIHIDKVSTLDVGGGTLAKITFTVPDDAWGTRFAVHATATMVGSAGPIVSATGGQSGSPMTLTVHLDVP